MLVGHVGRLAADVVGGWAADTENPDAAVDVIIYVDGKRVAQVACDQLREDLRDLQTYGEGRHGFRYQFPTPLPIAYLDRVSVRFVRTGALLPEGEKALPAPGRLQPILVTAAGRSGTTLMMNRLSRSPQICLAETPPFEVRLLSYWSTVVRTLTAEADHDRSMHPDNLEGDGFKVGSNPFWHRAFAAAFRTPELKTEYFKTYSPREAQDFARKMIMEYYLRLKDDQGKDKAIFFAEKANNLVRSMRVFTRLLFADTKEIVLVRDPRDLLCSHRSYFGSEPTRAFHDITRATAELLRPKQEDSPSILFIRYEDMISDEARVSAQLKTFLAVEQFQNPDQVKESRFLMCTAPASHPKHQLDGGRRSYRPSNAPNVRKTGERL